MKILMLAALAAFAIAHAAETRPTRIRAAQVKEPAVAAASVRIVMPSGAVVYAQLAADSFVLDTTTSPPTLRIVAPPATPPVIREYIRVQRSTGGTFQVPEGTLEAIYRNGVLLWPGDDYTIAGQVMTPVDQCCELDEVFVFVMRRDSLGRQ